ncbi:Os06g0475500 [Oryza sativa Japonica Group]|uniref:Os06g0475500 protein n=2 Tax=Oryza sativa subsp. japonica TaxID=39947 RepID=Q0DC73_ORYSJ|nr:hypothetical protein EE612_034141 [Oryza sativa]BAF19550.1 Os06g0475500 [Oryza sativa Japonica Group]BAS97773.1 Os06g0475500 [Oryza sativa Japonica Group]|eukprot:NP_001057636.1 Os06g0475500 [Oryza sativa Japonica Group]
MCRPGSSSLHNPPAGLDLPSLSGAPAACLLSLLSSRGWGPSGRPPPRYRASLSSSRKMQVSAYLFYHLDISLYVLCSRLCFVVEGCMQ